MKIENANPYEKMSESGSSLLRLIQNTHTPKIDLLVRESLQNSLDAADLNNSSPFVKVDITVKKIATDKIAKHFDEISDKLSEYTDCSYIAVRDSNTQGLTGPVRKQDVENCKSDSFGNYLKLVTEICKPQSNSGAGGSWGLGKTVYFRIGIGLVIYYSRIIVNGKYESRLAAALVEDETKDHTLLNETERLKRGIAWWGADDPDNKGKQVIPVTDENEIHRFLEDLELKAYSGDETGTTIVIPFIDEPRLLPNTGEISDRKPWERNLSDYLKICCQRWYAPRLNNDKYNGKYLKVSINEVDINFSDEIPFFQLIRELYNCRPDGKDIFFGNSQIHTEEISLNSVFNNECRIAGWLNWIQVGRSDLKMDPPENTGSPYCYVNENSFESDDYQDDFNSPIVLFTRKPAMVVSYNSNSWTDKIKPTGHDSGYLVCFFVLNSEVKLKNGQSLEEYIRTNEKADHMDWYDNQEQNFRIVNKIKSNITKKINEFISPKQHFGDEQELLGLGSKIADFFLPNGNFGYWDSALGGLVGDGGSGGINGIPSNSNTGGYCRSKAVKFPILSQRSESVFYNDWVELPLRVFFAKSRSVLIEFSVESENGRIEAKKWEDEIGTCFPISILKIKIESFNIRKNNRRKNADTRNLLQEPIDITGDYSHDGFCIEFIGSDNFNVVNSFNVRIFDNLLQNDFIPDYMDITVCYKSKGVRGAAVVKDLAVSGK